MSESQRRKRSRVACETCRKLKRKCDGARPCGTCVRFEYDCGYHQPPASSRAAVVPDRDLVDHSPLSYTGSGSGSAVFGDADRDGGGTASSVPAPAAAAPSAHIHLRSLEANSGAAFVRRLALNIDPNNAPRMHLFAWNVFLGARGLAASRTPRPLTDMLSQADMEMLAAVYFEKLDPCYGFVDRQDLYRIIKSRWTVADLDMDHDAVLCGVAALGYLFSHVHPPAVESDLVETARAILDRTFSRVPSATAVTAWVLRVVYLRIAGTPHEAWMASCIMMHMVEAAGLHIEPTRESLLQSSCEVDPDLRRRLFGVAQHLNIWMSFDMGRCRVTLQNTTMLMPSPRPGDFTIELLELLPYSAILDPDKASDASELEMILCKVLDRHHSKPPSILAQCNLVLCIFRRLQSLNVVLNGVLLDRVLEVTAKAIQSARAMVEAVCPWHHMANMPFQVACTLLAVDTPTSTSQLRDVMSCLNFTAAKYRTDATQEALKTASLLILLHKRRKERSVANLGEILRLYPVAQLTDTQTTSNVTEQPEDENWLDNLIAEIPSLNDFEFDQFLT